jgi:hypothetical protein
MARRDRSFSSAGLLGVALLAACASNPVPAGVSSASCVVGDTALVREVVYFGRNRPEGGTVSDADWRQFLDEAFTPRFPAGLTVVEATGQWQGQSGVVEQEKSEVVTVLHSGSEAALTALAEVIGEYKRRFHQEAVLRERTPTCARFE